MEGFKFFFLFVMKPCCVCRPVVWVFHVLYNQAVRKLSRGFRKVSVNEHSIPFKKEKKTTQKVKQLKQPHRMRDLEQFPNINQQRIRNSAVKKNNK